MPDETQATEMVKPEGEKTPEAQQPVEQLTADTVTLSKAELDKIQRALKEANAEAAKHRKALQAVEQAEQEKRDAQLSDLEKLQKQLAAIEKEKAEMAAALSARELADRKRAIAEKIGLPVELAGRLTGTTDEELEADAKDLLKVVKPPATQAKPQPGPVSGNPGANGSTGLTVDAQRERIYGARQDPWSVAQNKQQGGGAFIRSTNTGE